MAIVNVKSEIAGNVWKIQLKPGDRVEARRRNHDPRIDENGNSGAVPKAGTIKEIKVSEGEAIGEGQLVAILDA